jgi:hypothetical protein
MLLDAELFRYIKCTHALVLLLLQMLHTVVKCAIVPLQSLISSARAVWRLNTSATSALVQSHNNATAVAVATAAVAAVTAAAAVVYMLLLLLLRSVLLLLMLTHCFCWQDCCCCCCCCSCSCAHAATAAAVSKHIDTLLLHSTAVVHVHNTQPLAISTTPSAAAVTTEPSKPKCALAVAPD